MCGPLSLRNCQRIFHHLTYVCSCFVSAAFCAGVVVVDNVRWGFEWTTTCFLARSSRLSRFLSYNGWIDIVKLLVLLSFKRLQLINSCFVQCKLLIVQDIWVKEFFELTNSSSIVLLLLKTIQGVLMEFISFSFIKGINITFIISAIVFIIATIYICCYLCLVVYWSWLCLTFTSWFLITKLLNHWWVIKLNAWWLLFLRPQFF